MLRTSALATCLLLCAIVPPALAGESVDLDVVTRIRDEGLNRSQVMDVARHLTDAIGPRVTGSAAMLEANEWTLAKLEELGLTDGHLEPYEFGRGWSFERCSVHMLAPRTVPLLALPQGWTPGTQGSIRGEVVHVEAEDEEKLAEYAGQLAGKIVVLGEPRDIEPLNEASFHRYDAAELEDMHAYEIPSGKPSKWRTRWKKMMLFRLALNEFLVEEGALALVEVSSRSYGILRVPRGGSHLADGESGVPAVSMGAEHFNRIVRLLEHETPVELEIGIDATFYTEDVNAFNTIAEIQGSKKKDEVVMVGAHLDSYQSGDGATDNAGSCAVVMEAVRILLALDLEMDRTIRVALWSGEEQGLLGSRAYVDQHFASRPAPTDPEQLALPPGLREKLWPLSVTKEHARVSGYFNLDNGSGRIRGIYCESNAGVRPVFEAWMEPFDDLGAQEVTLNPTRGTDHMAFDAVGLPGFQFIQDRMNYMSQTHHSNLDTYDYLVREDMAQSAVILASFLYHAATRDDMLPRKPMPVPPPEEEEKPTEKEAQGENVAAHD